MRQLNKWFNILGLNGKVTAERSSRSNAELFSIYISSPGSGHKINIADSGFGFSQILPMLVAGVTSPQDSFIILEQPEIHLNPKIQTSLADVFVNMTKTGTNLIVETHSEHILLRLRTLIAKQEIKPSEVGLYFVERQGGVSFIREIPIEGDGQILVDAWPEDFFADSIRESLNLANSQMALRK